MDLTQFVDLNPDDPVGVRIFLDLNALNHQTIHNSLLNLGVAVEQYPMFSPAITPEWLDIHYKEHLAWANVLNLPLPPDLNNLDLTNKTQVEDWLNNHFLAHNLLQQALNL